MKFLFAFALIAVALAAEDIKGVYLPPAPAPEVASPDQIRIAPASLLDALNVPNLNEQAQQEAKIVHAETIFVGEIQPASEDIQNEQFKIKIADLPVDSLAEKHVQVTPIRTAEIPADVQNIRFMEPKVVEASIQPVKVAAPVFENAAPLAIEKVRVFDPSRPPRYADPVLR